MQLQVPSNVVHAFAKTEVTMSEQTGMPGELIYEHTVRSKLVTEYGVALNTLLTAVRH